MKLVIEVIDGDSRGATARVRDKLLLGRRASGLSIQDSKVSGRHAEVQLRPDGDFWLVDLGSANGIRCDGKRVFELRLSAGLEFRLGRTTLRVIDQAALEGESTAPEIVAEIAAESAPMGAPPPPSLPLADWRNDVLALIERAEASGQLPPKRQLKAFQTPLTLQFVRGLQTGTEWVIGYGPRVIGTESLDLTLTDSDLPAICFELAPDRAGATLTVPEAAKQVFRLNGKVVDRAVVKDQDVIELGDTQIKVSF